MTQNELEKSQQAAAQGETAAVTLTSKTSRGLELLPLASLTNR